VDGFENSRFYVVCELKYQEISGELLKCSKAVKVNKIENHYKSKFT